MKYEKKTTTGGEAMLDIVFIGVTLAFFAIACAYVRGCDQL